MKLNQSAVAPCVYGGHFYLSIIALALLTVIALLVGLTLGAVKLRYQVIKV